ncbi:MAG: sulfurtransferase [Acidobacteria bacterium]|jgi:thiosulfate/3-mercaptopyruvate sulfurtransferase|nr:sulfurtransferase [Acidobacteriota bacterium]
MLITPHQLYQESQGAAPPLLLDVRPAEEFAAGHLPGALHLDLWGISLIDTSDAPLRAFMWMVGHLFSLRGVTPDRPVVVYEKQSGIRAARAFWFLEYFGHPNVRVLDGGVPVWTAAGFDLTTDAVAPVPSTWHGDADDRLLATWNHVRGRLGNMDTAFVDTRSEGEYFGEVVRARRGGAIPGAVNLEWTQNLAADGTYKSAADLKAMYSAIGITHDREVVTYCQGGYRAAHTYLALRLLGFPRVRNYTGSWKEWGDREDLPVERPAR